MGVQGVCQYHTGGGGIAALHSPEPSFVRFGSLDFVTRGLPTGSQAKEQLELAASAQRRYSIFSVANFYYL